MSFIKPTFFSRIASARNFRKAAVTLHGNITARAQTRCGGISSVGGGGATLNRPEIASNFAHFRRFSAEPDRQLTWRVTVPGNQAYVIEREGKYLTTLYTDPDAPHLLDRSTDKIAFTHSLEKDVELSTQLSMTTDGHPWGLGLIFNVKVVDPYLASYGHGVEDGDSISAFKELATMMMSAALEEVSLGDYIFSEDLVERERVLKDSIDVLDDINKIVAGLRGGKKFQRSYDDEIKEKSAIADEERRKKEAKWIKKTEKSFSEVESRAEAILDLGEEHGKDEKHIEKMFNRSNSCDCGISSEAAG